MAIPLRVYAFTLIIAVLILIASTFFLAFSLRAQLHIFIIWIFTWVSMTLLLLLAVNAESNHRKMKALKSFIKQDENYILALKKLSESNTVNEYQRVDAKRKLAKLLAMER